MNQDQNTAVRGIVMGTAGLVGLFFPEYGAKAMSAALILYGMIAGMKQFLPPKVQDAV